MGTILRVPHMEQTDEWPCGDECLSAVMLLRYLGIRISMNEFVDFFLPQGQMRRREGQLTGPDPETVFAGSPYEKNSFGCYPEVMVKALNKMQDMAKKDEEPSPELSSAIPPVPEAGDIDPESEVVTEAAPAETPENSLPQTEESASEVAKETDAGSPEDMQEQTAEVSTEDNSTPDMELTAPIEEDGLPAQGSIQTVDTLEIQLMDTDFSAKDNFTNVTYDTELDAIELLSDEVDIKTPGTYSTIYKITHNGGEKMWYVLRPVRVLESASASEAAMPEETVAESGDTSEESSDDEEVPLQSQPLTEAVLQSAAETESESEFTR